MYSFIVWHLASPLAFVISVSGERLKNTDFLTSFAIRAMHASTRIKRVAEKNPGGVIISAMSAAKLDLGGGPVSAPYAPPSPSCL